MNPRAVLGKTVFFILICLFVSAFGDLFGQGNSQVGVVIVVLALTLLDRDMSVRPLPSLAMMLGTTAAMGLFSYLASGHALLGLVLNLTFVFGVCFVTMRDLNSPMHFPFLLGYALMLSDPVPAEELSARMLALMAGSCVVVLLNVAFNHGNRRKELSGISEVCGEVVSLIDGAMAGAEPRPERLERLCADVNRRLYGHLEGRFYSSPDDRSLLDVVVSLQVAGSAVCARIRDAEVLGGLKGIVSSLPGALARGSDDVLGMLDSFERRHGDADPELDMALRMLRDTLWRSAYRTTDRYTRREVPFVRVVGTVMAEVLRRDSARLTFSVRMAVMFSAAVLVWEATGIDGAKALMFAVIAMVQPFVEGDVGRTAKRLAGISVGIVASFAVLFAVGGDAGAVAAVLLLSNYVYTALDPKRPDITVAFITLSSMLTVSMAGHPQADIPERILFILIGVAAAFAANRLVLPYHAGDQNLELARRYLDLTVSQIRGIGRAAAGEGDRESDAALVLTAATVSAKISMNSAVAPDFVTGRFLAGQDMLTARCRVLSRSVGSMGAGCREEAVRMSSDPDIAVEVDPDGLEPAEEAFLSELEDVLEGYRRDAVLYARMVSSRAG